jgi:hypothetical protein
VDEVLPDPAHHAQPAAVVTAGIAVGDHPRQLARGGEILHLPLQRRDLGVGGVGRALQPLTLLYAEPQRRLPRRAGSPPRRRGKAKPKLCSSEQADDARQRR